MAQPGTASRGFGGRALSVVEVTPGTTPSNPALIKFSDHVQSVSISADPALESWSDIGDYDVTSFVKGLPVYGLRITYLLHVDRKTQMDDGIVRQADNSLKSQTIEVSANRDGTTAGYYRFLGAKANSTKVTEEVGKPTMVEIEYRSLSLTRATVEPSIGSGSRETAALGALSVGSTSSITRAAAAVGYITRKAEATISHGLNAQGTDGQVDAKALFEGPRVISGSIDFSIDDGGVALMDSVLAATEATVVFNLGAASAPKLTFTGAVWNNIEIPLDVQQGVVIQAVPFRAKAVTVGTV